MKEFGFPEGVLYLPQWESDILNNLYRSPFFWNYRGETIAVQLLLTNLVQRVQSQGLPVQVVNFHIRVVDNFVNFADDNILIKTLRLIMICFLPTSGRFSLSWLKPSFMSLVLIHSSPPVIDFGYLSNRKLVKHCSLKIGPSLPLQMSLVSGITEFSGISLWSFTLYTVISRFESTALRLQAVVPNPNIDQH